jgi:glutathione synthase
MKLLDRLRRQFVLRRKLGYNVAMRILVLTDTSEYGPEATLYPLMRALADRPEVYGVHVADRAIPENLHFFESQNLFIGQVYVRDADSSFSFETQKDYPVHALPLAHADAVWLRLDLASEAFLRYVEALWHDRFISNNPSGITRTATKAFLLSLEPVLGGLMPPVKLCYSLDNAKEFREQCPDMVLKVLNSFGGKGVVRYRRNGESDLNSDEDVRKFFIDNGPCLAMEYLDSTQQSDNRLIVSNGKILGALARRPKPGDWRCNLTAGGTYDTAEPAARELEIVRRADPVLRQLGIHFYGVDTLVDAKGERMLSEINTMNAGGAYRYELASGKPVCRQIAADFIANAFEARQRPTARPMR